MTPRDMALQFETRLNKYLNTLETLLAYQETLGYTYTRTAQKMHLLELRCSLSFQAIDIIALSLPLIRGVSEHSFSIILDIIFRNLQ